MSQPEESRLGRRVAVAGILAGLAVVLLLLERLPERQESPPRNVAAAQEGTAPVYQELDSLLAASGIERRAITTWRIQTPDKKTVRTEQRVVVPAEFVSVRFNHDLQERVAPYGVRVVATERTKERTVTMHLVKDGVVIRTISFVTKPGT